MGVKIRAPSSVFFFFLRIHRLSARDGSSVSVYGYTPVASLLASAQIAECLLHWLDESARDHGHARWLYPAPSRSKTARTEGS